MPRGSKRKTDPKRPLAGRITVDLGVKRKQGLDKACELRDTTLTAAISNWVDRFIALTPGMPAELMPPPIDGDPLLTLGSLAGAPVVRKSKRGK